MEKQIITFTADEQSLVKTGGVDCYASNTVSYIEADFTLGDNWSGYDVIRAVWHTDFKKIATVLDSNGTCIVPQEVLARTSGVKVNLVGSIVSDDEVTDRITTFPIVALKVIKNALVEGDNTAEVTPSQVEQFANAVHADAVAAANSADEAEQFADEAESWADAAEQSASQAGYMFFSIDANGHLILERTTNTEVDFYLDNGHLFVEVNA